MLCGQQTFIPDIGQHRFCTFPLDDLTNPNHDMPNQENKLKPHRSGEWTWSSQYPEIGPDLPGGEFYSEDVVRTCNECGAECDNRIQVCECGADCPNIPVV